MRIVNLDQGSKEWLTWRRGFITASDASAIMSCNPWETPYKCWQRKLGLIEEKKSNAAMEDGKRLEPIARDKFNEETGFAMKPVVVESSEIAFLGASLDGMDSNTILEIKCSSNGNLHDMARKGIIPDYYLCQMQHQLIVTRAEKCFYYSYYRDEGIKIEVFPDAEFEEKYLAKARDFWKKVAFFEPPSLESSDYRDMNDNLTWNEYANMYQEVDRELKALEDKKDYLRKKLIELCEDQSSQGSGLKIMKIITKGRIVYDEIPEIKNVDLEKHRKASVISWKFTIEDSKI